MFHILVVEDNPNARKLMEAVLKQNGYEPLLAADGIEALDVLDNKHVDLIVLDVMMPRMDGYEFTETLRSSGCDLPILMVTAKEKPADKRKGFIIGTDDYMVKPVDEEEMILRIAALLRRSKIVNEHRLTDRQAQCWITTRCRSLRPRRTHRSCRRRNFCSCSSCFPIPNKIFTRRQLMDEMWDMDSDTDERTVDVHINRLRDRFRNNPTISISSTVRGLGYKAVKRA